MSTNAEGLLNKLPTVAARLCGIAGVHSNDLMSSTFSLGFKDSEECSPGGVHDALGKMMVLDHIADGEVLNRDMVIVVGVLRSHFEMMISTLAANLQMCLGDIASRFPAPFAPLLAAAELPLLAPERLLRSAIETRVLNRVPFTIGQEGFQPDINADIGMLTGTWGMLICGVSFTDDESIPVSISTMNKMNRLGCPFDGAMQLDLEGFPNLSRDVQVFAVSIKPRIAACAILPQLDGVPAIRLLETREAHARDTQLSARKEAFEGLGKSIRKHLYGRGWHMLTASAFELCSQIVLRGERALLYILSLDGLKHLIIELARLTQALHQQAGLFLIWIQAVFKCSHTSYCTAIRIVCQMYSGLRAIIKAFMIARKPRLVGIRN